MEIKDGILVLSEEERGMLSSEEGKSYLKTNGFTEKVIEKQQAVVTDDIVREYISKNKSISDKLYNENCIKFLKSKLGDNVDIQTLGKNLVLEDNYNNLKQQAIKNAVALGLKGLTKHSDLLVNAVDYNKLQIDEQGTLTGFDEVVKDLQDKYQDLFQVSGLPFTPPALPFNEKFAKMTYEEFCKLSPQERAKVPNEVLNEILKS